MDKLTGTEKALMRSMILNKFHEKSELTEDKVKCFELISIAQKVGIDKETISEMESNYKSEFID